MGQLFLSTRFHGFHVLIGTTFLLVCLMRHLMFPFQKIIILDLKLLLDTDIFFDIVWLFLYVSFYWWGG